MSYTYESVKDRILQYILYKGITKKEFEQNSGLSNGYLNSLRDKPSETKLQSIYKAYPDINPVWLLSGVGNMLADISASSVDTSSNSSSVDLNRNERFKYLVAMLKKGGYIRNQKDLGIMMGYNIMSPRFLKSSTAKLSSLKTLWKGLRSYSLLLM